MVACECGHTEVAGVLIARGAIVNFQDKVRQSCMIRICITGGVEEWL